PPQVRHVLLGPGVLQVLVRELQAAVTAAVRAGGVEAARGAGGDHDARPYSWAAALAGVGHGRLRGVGVGDPTAARPQQPGHDGPVRARASADGTDRAHASARLGVWCVTHTLK